MVVSCVPEANAATIRPAVAMVRVNTFSSMILLGHDLAEGGGGALYDGR